MGLGARIRAARNRASMTQEQLAQACGISTNAISKFEKDQCPPSVATLIKIGDALHTTLDFLVRPPIVGNLSFCHRKLSKLPKRKQHALEVFAHDAIDRRLTLEVIVYGDHLPTYEGPREIAVGSPEDAEAAAESMRQAFGLGTDPIPNVIDALERENVRVAISPVEIGHAGSDGLCSWVREGVPLIMVSSDSGDRRRFTLAHELAHLVCKVDCALDDEAIGHRFAGAFLAPRPAIVDFARGERGITSVEQLRPLKRRYGISLSALVFRLRDCGAISPDTATALHVQLGMRGWRSEEPDAVPLEMPREADRLIERALSEHKIHFARAAELAGQPLHAFMDSRQSGEDGSCAVYLMR